MPPLPIEERCETCKYFAATTGDKGECHLKPRELNPNEQAGRQWRLPIQQVDDWCREWKKKIIP